MKALIDAQSSQLDSLLAAQRYLETGDRDHLSGPGGMLDEKRPRNKAIRSFQEQRYKYMIDNGMIRQTNQPEA